MRKSIITVLAALTVSVAAPAAAEEASVTVAFGDLDLTDPAGVATLESRIAAAVEEVCAVVEPRRLRGKVAWESCKAASLADAMKQLSAIKPSAEVALAAAMEN